MYYSTEELIKQTFSRYVHIIIMIVGALGGIVSVQCGNVTTTTRASKSTSPTTLTTLETSMSSSEVLSSKDTDISLPDTELKLYL